MAAIDALQSTLGYRFQNAGLLKRALAHPSLANSSSNQRLEFLGDAILGAVIAELLYETFPEETEGELARRHAALVRGETIAHVARAIKLGDYLSLAGSEIQTGGRDNASNLEDACEALIGALYLDGGLDTVKTFVHRHWRDLATSAKVAPKDAKTALQEWAQAKGLPLPVYELIQTTGPAHAPMFTIQVGVKGYPFVSAEAASKRAAEQEAAKRLLESVGS